MPTLLEAKDKVRTLARKALETVEDPKLTTAEKKTALDTIEPEIKTWTEEVSVLERFEETKKSFTDLAGPAGDEPGSAQPGAEQTGAAQPWAAKSLGQQFVDHDNYQTLLKGGGVSGKSGRWSTGAIELKTTLTEGTAGTPGGGYAAVATPTVLPVLVDQRFQPTTVLDLIPTGITTSPLLRYLVEVAVTNAAAAVAELGLKPESAIAFANVDEVLRKIATFLPVSDEMLEDFAQIRSYIDARLRLFVALQEEVQVLRGDGTGVNLVGFLNRPGLATKITRGTTPSVAGDNNMDAIYRQITRIRTTSFLEPEAVVIDPEGWQNIVLSKDGNGNYYAGGPFVSVGTPTLWGKPVVATTAMPVRTALVGAFRQASQTFVKGEITVEASNSHADFFQKNITAIRAERRRLLALYRPGAFGVVDGLVA